LELNDEFMNRHIIPQHLSIRAFRDNGYKDAAHALAELIDNSVQAGEKTPGTIQVEVICLDRTEFIEQRHVRRVAEIAVLDNASGMDAATLNMALQFGNGRHLDEANQDGIGKFGMGLPNASISQCRRVDVWSWIESKVLHTYLDVDEIESRQLEEVPIPKEAELPKLWISLAKQQIGASGTLVVWSKLDRVRWKGSRALLENGEAVVGRMYRYFISSKKVAIRLAAYEERGAGSPALVREWNVRANDPLYLMKKTSSPAPYDDQSAFDIVGEEMLTYEYRRRKHKVVLKYSITKTNPRKEGGNSSIGRHAAKNQGVSIVRARRELQLNRTFDDRSDARDRWWGVEVHFDPGLDEVFGVTNNKQDATAFYRVDLQADADIEELTATQFRELLKEQNDPRLIIYDISAKIDKQLGTMREQIKRMREGVRTKGSSAAPPGSAEEIASKATEQRKEKYGKKGTSDQQEDLPEEERKEKIAANLEGSEGMSKEQADELAEEIVEKHVKYVFVEGPLPGGVLFDVNSQMGGPIAIKINSNHPARDHFFELLKQESPDADSPALRGLKLLFSAWARLEDEASPARKITFEDIRVDWGIIARNFMEGLSD
jgi:hypothetical protein